MYPTSGSAPLKDTRSPLAETTCPGATGGAGGTTALTTRRGPVSGARHASTTALDQRVAIVTRPSEEPLLGLRQVTPSLCAQRILTSPVLTCELLCCHENAEGWLRSSHSK